MTNICYRYGGTSKHLVALCKKSMKKKEKEVEINLIFENSEGDFD